MKSDANAAGARQMNDERNASIYLNETFSEDVIRTFEDQLMSVFKTRAECYPTQMNNQQWLDFTDFVIKRRLQKLIVNAND